MSGGYGCSLPWFVKGAIYLVDGEYWCNGRRIAQGDWRNIFKWYSDKGVKPRVRVRAKRSS